jgi:hypothetical protein
VTAVLSRVLRTLLLFVIAASFLLFVWPTRWRHDHMTVDGNIVPVRIDRITGDADMLVPDEGWIPVEAPLDGSAEPEPRPS